MKLIAKFAQGTALLVVAPFALNAGAAEPSTSPTGVQGSTKAVEEIVVTGSYIRGTPEDAALPVDVITQAELQQQGSPTVLEMIRNLGITSGNIGEENQFQPGRGQGASAVTTINLRGLGSARTLVLMNGRRQVADQANGVDVQFIPQIALARTEILKDGAAALYGSDAIAGVVNFITRGDFEGIEVTGSNQWIQDSDGQQYAGVIWGLGNDRLHWMTALEYDARQELKLRDRDWAVQPRPNNPAGGWSSIANPATLYPSNFASVNGELAQADSQCEVLGGAYTGAVLPSGYGPGCAFQYTYFDNLVNPTNSYRGWTELNYEVSEHSTAHFAAGYTRVKYNVNTSPSYPPQSLFGPDRYIAPTHPGLIQYKLDNPDSVVAIDDVGVFALARAFGSTGWFGDSQRGDGETNTYRLELGISGDAFEDAIGYDFAVTYSHRERVTETPDTTVERMAFALDGLGGPNCVPGGSDPATSTPGTAPCYYYNPFSNAIQQSVINGAVNPQFNPALANNPEMSQWLIQWQHYNVVNELLVWDGVLTGETPIKLPGGAVSWAAGVQARNEKFDVGLNSIANRAENPCPFNDPYSVTIGNISQAAFDACQNAPPGQQVSTGLLSFLSAYDESSTSRTIYAAFSEFALPITDTVDMQLAVRFEDYGGQVGSTIDPKAAIRWQATDWLTLRGSISTTFRGPPQSYLSGRTTTLQYVVPTNAFKAVDIVGNPDLEPEKAVASNVGVIVQTGGFYGSIDYWEYNFSDPFQTESAAQLINAYTARGCQGPPGSATAGPGYGTPDCDELSRHIFPVGTAPSGITRIDTYITNGSDIDTSGFDFLLQYTFDNLLGGELTVGTQGTYTIEYKSEDFVDLGGVFMAPGGDFVGEYNTKNNPFNGLPQWKGNAFVRYAYGGLNVTALARYVDSYKDLTPSLPYMKDIDSWTSYDVTALYQWGDFTVTGSVFNLTDEDPPQVSNDINYDVNNVSGIGRSFKLQVTYTLGAG